MSEVVGPVAGPAAEARERRHAAPLVVAAVALVILGLCAVAACLAAGRVWRVHPFSPPGAGRTALAAAGGQPAGEPTAAFRLPARGPRGVWVAVDTYAGRLRVFRGEELLREAVCSAGSGLAVRDPRTRRLWVFTTPLGERTVQRKAANPVWVKPDWAFVEEGYVPPPLGSRERRDAESLGDYALYLGDGYLIHGTLFQSLLGRRVTHGCIRLGDEDLAWVYRNVPTGARVYLY